jgi:ABC-2 type transport system permease protein
MYRAFAASAFQTQLAYRNQVWASLFGQLIQVFAAIAIWMSVYGQAGSVDGITRGEMLAYATIAGTLLVAWDEEQLLYAIDRSIKSGNVSVYLLKPLSYPLYLLATEVGNLAYRLAAVAIPVLLVVWAVYGVALPASPVALLQFVLFFVLAFLMLFCLAAFGGLCAFWLMTAFSIAWMLRGILLFASGTFVPFWFFPEPLGDILAVLPFAYVGFHPMAAYLGKVGEMQSWLTLLVGCLWLVALALATLWLWRRATTRIVVQGG